MPSLITWVSKLSVGTAWVAGVKRLMEEMGWTREARGNCFKGLSKQLVKTAGTSLQMLPRDPFYRKPIEILSFHPDPGTELHKFWMASLPCQDPFWGQPTADVDWCEANYVHSRYVAEFFNTMSSIPMLLVSLWGLFLCFKYQLEARFYLCWLGIGVVGVGSVSFHGTLHPTGQAIDELGMICASLAFLYVVLEVGHLESWRPWLPVLEMVYAVGFAVAYFASPFFFPVFVAIYAATVLLIIHQAYRNLLKLKHCFRVYQHYVEEDSTSARWQRCLFWMAAIGYPAGFLFLWVPENTFCPLYPQLFQRQLGTSKVLKHPLHLHALFHIVTTMSPYCYVVFMTYHRCLVLKREAEHRLGIGLAYVHVKEIAP
eukprot:Skav205634  [mRNA]  locus=scaffold2404:54154:57643:+ [translate_table: standard]